MVVKRNALNTGVVRYVNVVFRATENSVKDLIL